VCGKKLFWAVMKVIFLNLSESGEENSEKFSVRIFGNSDEIGIGYTLKALLLEVTCSGC
jgi:hypothetical protein